MQRITFHCETVTPMFLAGADGKTPELRAPSLKGMLRFWWRAIQVENIEELKRDEAAIFGSSDESVGRSKFRLLMKGEFEQVKVQPLPHHTGDRFCPHLPKCGSKNDPNRCSRGYKNLAIKADNAFQIITDADKSPHNLFVLASILGGLGKRSRRGFGSFEITHIDNNPLPRASMESILIRLNEITDKYKIDGSKIVAKDFPDLDYPYIKSIQFGATENSYQALLKKIGETSHTHDSVYTGTTIGTRLASPINVSIIKNSNGEFLPIITLLNTVFKPGYEPKGKNLQNSFIGALL